MDLERKDEITGKVIGAAIEVHRLLGPGLLESAYEACLCHEMELRSIVYQRQVELPVKYKDFYLGCGYRVDMIVEDTVIVELKVVESILPVHKAQLLTYLKLTGKPVGLLLNFHEPILKKGITRFVL